MAFRIHDHVERGEIDNRVNGIVRGTIWVKGCAQPGVLELQGNEHPDLAGCWLSFTSLQAGLEAVAAKQLPPADMVAGARKEAFEIREGILKRMDEYRGRK